MEENVLSRGWRKQLNREGVFDRYWVQGLRYSQGHECFAWLTTSWPSPMRDPVHSFWVEGSTLYRVRAQSLDTHEIGIDAQTKDIEPDEKRSVLMAISVWEQEQTSSTVSASDV